MGEFPLGAAALGSAPFSRSLDLCVRTTPTPVLSPHVAQCGVALESMGMGGMDEMGVFYDHCLETLCGCNALRCHLISARRGPL